MAAKKRAAPKKAAPKPGTSSASTGPKPSGPKPPYRIPLMSEIVRVPPSGLRSVSTFSGTGGSSLGQRMAGIKVAAACEFIESARDSYRLNSPGTPIFEQDIRSATGADMLRIAGIKPGELDILEGSPPCSSFSLAGKREKGWGETKKYSDGEQRSDDLFFEFARLLREIQPRAFIAENVAGMVVGTAKGYFKWIIGALQDAGYVVRAQVLDGQWLGVPQARRRLIFVGMRKDLGIVPELPKPMAYRYTVRDAIFYAEAHGRAMSFDDLKANGRDARQALVPSDSGPAPTILAAGPRDSGIGYVVGDPRRVIHDTSGLFGSGDVTDRPSPTVTVGINSVNSQHYQVHPHGFDDPDLVSYDDAGNALDPETGKPLSIKKYAIGREYERTGMGKVNDRYMSLVRAHPDKASHTVTATGGIMGAAGVVHPLVPRKFSLRELRRICGFPDDFQLAGTYEQRWERLGRAVPPPMMAAVAASVRDQLLALDGKSYPSCAG